MRSTSGWATPGCSRSRGAGMTRFTVAGYWGNAQITAADMARFFGDLDRAFARRHRVYAKGLLGVDRRDPALGHPDGRRAEVGGAVQGGWLRSRPRPSGGRASGAPRTAGAVDGRAHGRSAVPRIRDRDGAWCRRAAPRPFPRRPQGARSGSRPNPRRPPPRRAESSIGERPLVRAVRDDLRAQRPSGRARARRSSRARARRHAGASSSSPPGRARARARASTVSTPARFSPSSPVICWIRAGARRPRRSRAACSSASASA